LKEGKEEREGKEGEEKVMRHIKAKERTGRGLRGRVLGYNGGT